MNEIRSFYKIDFYPAVGFVMLESSTHILQGYNNSWDNLKRPRSIGIHLINGQWPNLVPRVFHLSALLQRERRVGRWDPENEARKFDLKSIGKLRNLNVNVAWFSWPKSHLTNLQRTEFLYGVDFQATCRAVHVTQLPWVSPIKRH